MMKSILITALLCLQVVHLKAQVSSIFQMNPIQLDIPAFNPAFCGDSKEDAGFRFMDNIGVLKTQINDQGFDSNYLVAIDDKIIPNKNTNIRWTYGTTININSIVIEGETDAFSNQIGKMNFRYGFIEGYLGFRLVTRKSTSFSQKEQKRKFKKPLRAEKSVFNTVQRNPEVPRDYRSYESLNYTALCSPYSSTQFMSVAIVYGKELQWVANYENGAFFGDQIVMLDPSGGNDPYFYNPNSADPLSSERLYLSNTSYLGAGALFHWSKNDVTIRGGYSHRSFFQNYSGVPGSSQTINPLKVIYVGGYDKSFGNKGILMFNAMYLDQSPELFPQWKSDIKQYRVGTQVIRLLTDNLHVNETKENYKIEEVSLGTNLTFMRASAIISPKASVSFRSNVTTGSKKQKYAGWIWTISGSASYYVGALKHRDLQQTFHVGIGAVRWKKGAYNRQERIKK